jgi:hypothetical protein
MRSAAARTLLHVCTVTHADHDDVIGVGISAWMMEIKRDKIERSSSQKTIDDATPSAATTAGVAPTRAAGAFDWCTSAATGTRTTSNGRAWTAKTAHVHTSTH